MVFKTYCLKSKSKINNIFRRIFFGESSFKIYFIQVPILWL